jgi:hypothetical protein
MLKTPQPHLKLPSANIAASHLSRDQDPAVSHNGSVAPNAARHPIPNPNVPNVAQRAATLDSYPLSDRPKQKMHQRAL